SVLDQIYILLRQPLYSFIYRYSRDEQLSIDIVQDTFIKLQRHKHDYNPDKGKLKSYLFQIAYRLMVTKLNRRKKWRSLLPFLTPSDAEDLHHADRIAVRTAVTTIPASPRGVIILFYYNDVPQRDIATILEIHNGTVNLRLHAAIPKLTQELEVEDCE